ncbi:hypothetical protein [Actinomadura sp. NPDC000600]|uniref:hypothetical protein n=1 Tax=Actinomadura sp. NPDC000600 TaxID=3154262 RepID=UPI003396B8F3
MVLTENLEQTRAFLTRQTGSRRILVIYGGEAEGIRELRNYGQVAVISLSSPTETPMVGARDHEAPHAVALSGIDCLAPLSKDDAFNQLMSMPTIARLSRP